MSAEKLGTSGSALSRHRIPDFSNAKVLDELREDTLDEQTDTDPTGHETLSGRTIILSYSASGTPYASPAAATRPR